MQEAIEILAALEGVKLFFMALAGATGLLQLLLKAEMSIVESDLGNDADLLKAYEAEEKAGLY